MGANLGHYRRVFLESEPIHHLGVDGWMGHFSKSARSGAPPVVSPPAVQSLRRVSCADVGHPPALPQTQEEVYDLLSAIPE